MSSEPLIGYVVKMFPRLSETFIRNEIMEMERQGLPLRIFSLKRPTEAPALTGASQVNTRTVYLPERVYREPFRVVRAHCGVLRRFPAGYCRTLIHVLRGRELRSLPRGLRRFCQTCCLVHELGRGRHLHAHFASDPTRLASWARMICGISFSVSTHAKDLFQDDRVGSPGLQYKLKAARFVVANSQFSASALLASLSGHSETSQPPKVFTVYNGIDMALFAPRRKEPSEPLILSVGRLIEKKGFPQLIRACALLRQQRVKFQCEIVGSGPLKLALQDEITRLGLEGRVRLRGERAHVELLPLYHRALVFALPCVVAANGDRDILPNVLKEAMAVGIPVVTTHLDGIEELVSDGQTGLLVTPGDADALASALRHLLEDASLRQKLAAAARKVIEEKFDSRKNFRVLRALLAEVVQPEPVLAQRELASSIA